jgi:putative phage-type endonuclease
MMTEDRNKFIGASDVAAIMGISPFKTAYQLWLEKTGRVEPEDISDKFHVKRGVAIEEQERAFLEAHMGLDLIVGTLWEHRKHDFMKCHEDGWDKNKNWIVEIKYMGEELVQAEEIPDYYMAQIQYELMLSGAERCVFRAVSPKDCKFAKMVEPLDLQLTIYEACMEFWHKHVLEDVPPPLSKEDTIELSDPVAVDILTRIADLDDTIKKLPR